MKFCKALQVNKAAQLCSKDQIKGVTEVYYRKSTQAVERCGGSQAMIQIRLDDYV
jgi:hypothetical protein